MSDGPEWSLKPGDTIRRKEIHNLFGGGRQSGISPSRKSPNVLIFSDPGSGVQHGYIDEWEDGVLLYTGEGQRGDQQLTKGNDAILQHRAQKRDLRVFEGSGGIVRYLGEFEVDPLLPFTEGRAPETGSGPLRKVLIFRLLPVGSVSGPRAGEMHGTEVPLEQRRTEQTTARRPETDVDIVRRESELVEAFVASLGPGAKATRLKCTVPGSSEASALYSDLYLSEDGLLIEAKGVVTRDALRMAIGQLMDYRRFAPENTRLAVLLPRHPGPDLESLLSSVGIAAIWRRPDSLFDDNRASGSTNEGRQN